MKSRDLVILLLGSIVLLALLGSIALDGKIDEVCMRLRTGGLIGGIIMLSIWGLTKLHRR